jgi:hypothetical protein
MAVDRCPGDQLRRSQRFFRSPRRNYLPCQKSNSELSGFESYRPVFIAHTQKQFRYSTMRNRPPTLAKSSHRLLRRSSIKVPRRLRNQQALRRGSSTSKCSISMFKNMFRTKRRSELHPDRPNAGRYIQKSTTRHQVHSFATTSKGTEILVPDRRRV